VRLAAIFALVITLLSLSDGPAQAGSGGDPFHGWLVDGEPFPEGPHHRLLHHVERSKTYFGTAELVDGLLRAAATVAEKLPGGQPLAVGNLSRRTGGDIPESHTHNSGRDVDLSFFMEKLDGTPARAKNHHFRPDGLSRRNPKRYRLDVEANWALVEALMSDPAAGLQWLILEPHIELLLLAHAKAQGVPAEQLRRYADIMTLPPYAGSHENHLHVRVQCSPTDWADRCQPTGPVWSWRTTLYPLVTAEAERVAPKLDDQDPLVRMEALAAAWSKGLAPLLAHALPLLDDTDPRVRRRARKMLPVLIGPSTSAVALRVAEDLQPVTRRLITLWTLRRGGLAALPTAREVMAGTHATVSPKPTADVLRDLQVAARRLLIRERPVAELLGL
jgi:penicillin-insensitive murein DD-endopeptidase